MIYEMGTKNGKNNVTFFKQNIQEKKETVVPVVIV